MHSVTVQPRRSLRLVVLAPLVLAACSASGASPSVAAQPPATASAVPAATPAPTASPTQAASAAAVESPSAAASGGPVDFVAWVERQGFGGTSGLKEVAKETNWMRDHPVEVTPFDIQTTQRLVDHLATWLDENPATACWTDYHATVLTTLRRIHDAEILAHDARAANEQVPTDVVTSLVKDANALDAMPKPAGC